MGEMNGSIGLSLFFNIIMCWYRVWGRGCDTTDSQMSPQPRRNLPIKWDFMVLCASMWLPNILSRLNYNDLIMRAMASQIISLTVVYQTQIKENIKAPRHWPLRGEFTGTGEFPAQRASNAESVSIWWRHEWNYNVVTAPEWNMTRVSFHVTLRVSMAD